MKFHAEITQSDLGRDFKETIDGIKTQAVFMALMKTRGNKCHAAKMICLNRNTLSKYFNKLSWDKKRIIYQLGGIK